jgi:hypothetical protein
MASRFSARILPDLKLRLIIFEHVIEFGLEDREMKLMRILASDNNVPQGVPFFILAGIVFIGICITRKLNR